MCKNETIKCENIGNVQQFLRKSFGEERKKGRKKERNDGENGGFMFLYILTTLSIVIKYCEKQAKYLNVQRL